MLRDVFYFGKKPNVHPREQHAENLNDARLKATTRDFWVINEFCDYRNFDWDFDFEFLPDEDVWAEDHNNVWPSQHQKDSGTWLCPKKHSDIVIYRNDVDPLLRKNEKSDNWVELDLIDHTKFDFSWHPDPTDPPYIYKWGCKYFPAEFKHVLEYRVPGAIQEKYMSTTVELLPDLDRWVEYQEVDKAHFDLSWRPSPLDPPFIYVWGNKYVDGKLKSTIEYHMEGATDKKYMPELVPVLPEWDKWVEVQEVDKATFDFSWRPDPREPAYIYVFGNEAFDAVKMPTLEYHCEGATERKYMDTLVAKLAPNPNRFEHLEDSFLLDYSWLPDPDSPPYIYAWGNQWNSPEDKVSVQFVVPGATEYKFMTDRAIRKPCMDNWIVPDDIDTTGFDFSWEPSPAAPPYIYEFATQWQKTGGPQYVVSGATEKQYVDFQKVTKLPSNEGWTIPSNIDSSGFDFSWHPDDTSPPYVYVFATQWAFSGGPVYTVPGATEIKYVDDQVAKATVDMTNWVYDDSLIDTSSFDFSWHPYIEDQPYIYEFGTQWQKTGGPKYITPGADSSSPTKYIDTRILKAKRLPNPQDTNWKILNDYKIKEFDFSWHPDNTDEPYIYVFGNNLYPAEEMPTIEYHVPGAKQVKFVNDIFAILDQDRTNWVITQPIDEESFDFSWKPNPNDPPYIYRWGNKYISNKYKATIEYVVPGATEIKYMTDDVEVVPEWDKWEIPSDVDTSGFDFTWRPDPLEPDLIYEFATQWQKTGGPRYVVPGATETKYLDLQKVTRLSSMIGWTIPKNVDTSDFDFSWHPDATDPAYIYQFGTQWALTGGPKYVVDGATEIKYVDALTAKALADKTNWVYNENEIDVESFDFSWHPYVEDQPYIYEFGTQWQKTGGPRYITPGADSSSPIKYIDTRILKATRLPNKDNWNAVNNYVISDFDYSWHPDNTEEPYIYVFGNNLYPAEECPTIQYKVTGATKIKYVDTLVATLGEDRSNWVITQPVDEDKFDFTWKPNPNDPAYIYRWGNKYISGVYKSTIDYVVPGATEIKYMTDDVEVVPEYDRWEIPDGLDTTNFDFSWRPDPLEPDQIYQFGTQWQKTGGPRYTVPGATEVKYISTQRANKLASMTSNWSIPENIDITGFDFSWHPDDTSPPYIYVFATQWAFSGGPQYTVEGATEIKYVDDQIAKAKVDMTNWVYDSKLIDVTSFDFSWHPYTEDQPYIYEFGTQWQKTGGPKYITPGADSSSPIKYIDTRILAAKRLPNKKDKNWKIFYKIKDFDFSWHPDETEEPYIYVFGNNLYPAEECPTVEYVVPGATKIKYINNLVATLDNNLDNWVIPDNVDTTGFDFSWIPNPTDPAYIYEFGTQWQKTGGPRYVVPGATETKYLDFQKVTRNANSDAWIIPDNVDVTDFDFSWHPDDTDPAYIYQFGTQWALSGGPKYIVDGATEIKYMDNPIAKALADKTNWVYNENEIDVESFDFSWHPYIEDQPYIYQFGTQWQKTGGPKYITPGADSSSPVKYIDTRIIKATRLPNKSDTNWKFLFEIADFDFSWHPDDTDEPYIYVFGNTQYSAEDMPTVEYRMPGATQVKYIHGVSAKLADCRDNWVIHTAIDEEKFDFSWRPHPKDPAYIYRWGNKYVSNKYEPTVEYIVLGATEIKYMTDDVVVLPESDRWFVPKGIDVSDFDFTWRPDPLEPPQIYQFGTQWQKTGGPTYTFPGATAIKYVDFQKARHLPKQKNWVVPENVDATNFDFSWHPDDTSPPYIYVFPTKWALSGGPRYVVPGATQTKYVETDSPVNVLPSKANWEYDAGIIDAESFDFSWHPYDEDQPYIYQFGTQWQKTGGPRYIAPGATNNSPIKYVDTRIIKATRLPDKKNWSVVEGLVVEDFDYSWHPDETETPYIYVFGNTQYGAEDMPTVQYTVPGATEIKYVHDVVAKLGKNMTNWEVPSNIDTNDFDFGWVPHPKSPPYIYEFSTVWNNRGGPRYVVPGATEFKYVDDIKAKLVPSKDNWEVDEGVDVKLFDFSWVPHPEAPPYIYQFGTILDKNDGPRYVTPGNDGEVVYRERVEIEETDKLPVYRYYIETTLEDLIYQHPDEMFWAMRKNINYDDFDFSWRPDIEQAQYVHAFGSADSELTQTYLVSAPQWINGNRDFNWVENVELTEESLVELFVKPDMFYVDRGNSEANSRFEALKAKYGTRIQKTRYLNSWVDTINRCSNRATSDVFWVLNSELDYTDFNFDYYPNPWQMKMVHVFGTQWSHWGTTFMVNRESFREDTKYIKIIEHLSNLNFVKDIRAKATQCVHDIVVIDHGNPEITNVLDIINSKASGRSVTTVAYSGSYLDTLKDIVKRQQEKKEHYIWVCSSVCDYTEFDFSYICDPFARDNLHVFPSGMQKFGDTFFVDVNLARELLGEIEKLDEYKINFNATVKAKRLPEPVIVTADDTHVVAAKNVTGFPYATLITQDNVDIEETAIEPMNLWAPDTKNILITSTGGTRIVVPTEVKDHSTVELYEYPYIKRMPKLAKSKALDIVFVSNGETVADQNYEHLLNVTNGLANKIHRIDGINGRTEALHAAAEASQTLWFFGVPAKLLVNKKFDWNYQADRLQMPKHYIFNALNPVNDLFYGHQSMVLYNKNLVLGNKGVGLDFTLDSPHMAVELNSGIVVGDTDEYSTWRTAFREAVKLKKYSDNGDDTAKKRLAVWTSVGKGNYGEWSIKGALDGIEFYNEANGDLATLRQSYYWDWLKTRFDSKY